MQALGEGDIGQTDVESTEELTQSPQTLQFGGAVDPIPALGAGRGQESDPFEVPQHPRRPTSRGRGFLDGEALHGRNLSTSVSRFQEYDCRVGALRHFISLGVLSLDKEPRSGGEAALP